METEFTPWASLAGGGLIGLSAVLLMATHGRIAGISGITSKLFSRSSGGAERAVSGVFVLGLLLAAPLWFLVSGGWPAQWVPSDPVVMIVAGLLVGIGAAWGSGCTSGHGVCGISRLSARSIVTTATFMATAIATVFITRHVIGL
ncbi:hypothetical protein LCGC14_2209170 [marine sediment metagenome]|uniref:Uncharacterized protein n=1 Tax=marine sediment metagenome TaxID=412755 RepID=A0A0F9GA17_9ZZZZ